MPLVLRMNERADSPAEDMFRRVPGEGQVKVMYGKGSSPLKPLGSMYGKRSPLHGDFSSNGNQHNA